MKPTKSAEGIGIHSKADAQKVPMVVAQSDSVETFGSTPNWFIRVADEVILRQPTRQIAARKSSGR